MNAGAWNRKKATAGSLPPHAKLAFKGKIFEVWKWEQKMFDGSTAIFERIIRPNTVEVIATTDGKIIIQEQQQPDHDELFFSLPGGRADYGDDMLEEAKRELLEETGYTTGDWTPWKVIIPSNKVIYSIHYFIARNCLKTKEPQLDPGERISLKFITLDELLLLSDDPKFREGDLVNLFLRMRLHSEERQAFEKAVFG